MRISQRLRVCLMEDIGAIFITAEDVVTVSEPERAWHGHAVGLGSIEGQGNCAVTSRPSESLLGNHPGFAGEPTCWQCIAVP